MHFMPSRRGFLASLSAISAAGVVGTRASLADEGPPETATVRLKKTMAICFAPLYVVETFLRAEGFTNVRYVTAGLGIGEAQMVGRGDLEFGVTFAGVIAHQLDAGQALTVLGGVHVGCYELFANEPIRTISDLEGRRVALESLNSAGHLYLSIMATHVGLDPKRDIEWVIGAEKSALDVFAEGKADAFLGFPPEPQKLRAQGYDRIILNTVLDRPWSQYFCCMMYGNRAWVREHPIATKRFLRAMYKAAEFCTAEPHSAARQLLEGGYAERYDYAPQTLTEVPYDRWRESHAEDSMRFYALRLHEVGMITSRPNALLAEGTDWRFLNELKRELKV